jgi:hypothetical protein
MVDVIQCFQVYVKKRVEMISSGAARKHRSLDLTDSKGEDFSH